MRHIHTVGHAARAPRAHPISRLPWFTGDEKLQHMASLSLKKLGRWTSQTHMHNPFSPKAGISMCSGAASLSEVQLMSLRFAPLVPPHAGVSFISFQKYLNRAGNIQAQTHKEWARERVCERARQTKKYNQSYAAFIRSRLACSHSSHYSGLTEPNTTHVFSGHWLLKNLFRGGGFF